MVRGFSNKMEANWKTQNESYEWYGSFFLVFFFYIKFFSQFVVLREKINLWVAPKIKRIFYMPLKLNGFSICQCQGPDAKWNKFKLEYPLDLSYHCKKYCSFHLISCRPKLCGNCAFPQNYHTAKLGEITAFFCSVSFRNMTVLVARPAYILYQIYIHFCIVP